MEAKSKGQTFLWAKPNSLLTSVHLVPKIFFYYCCSYAFHFMLHIGLCHQIVNSGLQMIKFEFSLIPLKYKAGEKNQQLIILYAFFFLKNILVCRESLSIRGFKFIALVLFAYSAFFHFVFVFVFVFFFFHFVFCVHILHYHGSMCRKKKQKHIIFNITHLVA